MAALSEVVRKCKAALESHYGSPSGILNRGLRHDHGDADLPEEHAGGGLRRDDQTE